MCFIFFETLLCCLLSLGTTNTSLLLQPPSRPPFPMLFAHSPAIETISIGTPQQHDLFVDSDLTALQARAIALEAATSKTGGRVFFSRHPLLCLWCRKYMKNVPTTIFLTFLTGRKTMGNVRTSFFLPLPPVPPPASHFCLPSVSPPLKLSSFPSVKAIHILQGWIFDSRLKYTDR